MGEKNLGIGFDEEGDVWRFERVLWKLVGRKKGRMEVVGELGA